MYKLMAVSALALALGGTAARADVVVNDYNPGGWTFSNADNLVADPTNVGQFVTGPGTPPLGTGSANLQVYNGSSSEILINGTINPGALGSTFAASYQTYVTSSTPGSGSAPNLEFDLTNGPTYFGRLVFDPGLLQPAAVTTGQWQNWDTSSASGWYFTHSSSQFSNACSINAPCTLSTAEADLATASVTAEDVIFKAGSDQTNFNANVDDLVLTINGTTTTYDFEPVPEPASLTLLGISVLGLARIRSRKS
ncbi:MAG TPA: PEP-CTERM sorting domain-containing protein [Rhodopila sp.]|jgi:hypothetical protein